MEFGRPERRMGKSVQETPDQRTRVLVILCPQRPPLGHKSVRLQPLTSEFVEITRVEIDNPGGGRRWWLERNEVIAVGAPQEFTTAIGYFKVHAGIRSDSVVARELRRGADNGGKQLSNHTTFERFIRKQRSRRDTRSQSDHEC